MCHYALYVIIVSIYSRGIYSSQFQILFLLDPSNSFLKAKSLPPLKKFALCANTPFFTNCTFHHIITMVYNHLVGIPY